MLIIPCPECAEPASVRHHFGLPSTDGPVEMVTVSCTGPAGHGFLMALDGLAAGSLAMMVEQRLAESRSPRMLVIPCPECTMLAAAFNLRCERDWGWTAEFRCTRPGGGHRFRDVLRVLPAESLVAMLGQLRLVPPSSGAELAAALAGAGAARTAP
jgi:hypothetical protein